MNEKLHQIVEESIKLEMNMASLFEIFSSRFPEDSDFWNKLSKEEINHASIIKAGSYALTDDEFPTELLSPSLKELVEINNKIISLKKEYTEKRLSRKSAFEVASSLEQSAGEMHYNEAMDKQSQNNYIRILKKLNQDDKDHYKRILDYMSSKGF